jgi:hypothetical protein
MNNNYEVHGPPFAKLAIGKVKALETYQITGYNSKNEVFTLAD